MQEAQSAALHTGTANYSWAGVIEFLQDQLRQNTIKHNEWLLEKQQLLTELGKTEGELKAMEIINGDLMKRVKMLEFCLRQERIKYSALLANKNINTPELKNIIENQFNNHGMASAQFNNLPLPKRRAKNSKNSVLKFLEEVGYEDLFSNEAHGEIKGLHPSQRNSSITEPLYKHTDEADKTEHLSVLDHSSFKRGLDKSPDPRYSSIEDKDIPSDLSPYRDERSFRLKNTNVAGAPKDLRTGYSVESTSSSKIEWKQKSVLRGHFDGVRDLFVFGSDSILCSVSEDCVVKIWDLNKLKKGKEISTPIDSYLTLREHTGLLFAVSGAPSETLDTRNKRLLYTAGSEGIVRVWNVPSISECDTFGPNSKSYCVAAWSAHKDSIWEINHHPFKHQIMSVGSDGYIKIWETLNSTNEVSPTGKVRNQFFSKTGYDDQGYLIPTSATWLHTHLNHIAAGYVNSNSILIYDEENKTKPISTLKFEPYTQGPRFSQPNKLISHPHMNVLIAAHEDRYLRFFDLTSNKMVQSILAHHDSVTSVCYQASTTNVISVSHDGSLKIWDLRKYGLVQEISGIHLRKYDEQIHCVTSEENSQFIFTGGADGLVSILERV